MSKRCTKQEKTKIVKLFLNTCEMLKQKKDILIEESNQTTIYNFGEYTITERTGRLTGFIELKTDVIIGQINFSLDDIIYDIDEILIMNFISKKI